MRVVRFAVLEKSFSEEKNGWNPKYEKLSTEPKERPD
jgi:hypothetical protein